MDKNEAIEGLHWCFSNDFDGLVSMYGMHRDGNFGMIWSFLNIFFKQVVYTWARRKAQKIESACAGNSVI